MTVAVLHPQTVSFPENPLEGLPLTLPTPPGWAAVALQDPGALLRDHAHCELKAAGSALSLLARHPGATALLRPLLALGREEMRHFRQVCGLLEEMDVPLGRPQIDPYVRLLRRRFCSEGTGVGALGDQLLVAAFIEARSCERFRLLAAALAPAREERPAPHNVTARQGKAAPSLTLPAALARRLAVFYTRLARAEARHWETYKNLAAAVLRPADRLARRLAELAPMETEILASLTPGPRIH